MGKIYKMNAITGELDLVENLEEINAALERGILKSVDISGENMIFTFNTPDLAPVTVPLAHFATNLQGHAYIGLATPSTTPVTLKGNEKVFYIATEEGDYSNFGLGNISELSMIKSDGGSWKAESFSDFSKLDEIVVKNLNAFESVQAYLLIDGAVVNNTSFTTYKYEVNPLSKYYISSKIGANPSACLLQWRDADNKLIAYDGVVSAYGANYEFNNHEFLSPSNAQYMFVSCRNTFSEYQVSGRTDNQELLNKIPLLEQEIQEIKDSSANIGESISELEEELQEIKESTGGNIGNQEVLNKISALEEQIRQIKESGTSVTIPHTLNILCLGNSFTADSMGYFPWIFKEILPEVILNLYLVYIPGAPIARHLAFVSQEDVTIGDTTYHPHGTYDTVNDSTTQVPYTVYKYLNGSDYWTSQSNITADGILLEQDWDIITIQQSGNSNHSDWDTNFKPYIYKLLQSIHEKVNNPFRFGYIMTHAAYTLDTDSLQTRFDGIVLNTQKILNNTPIDVILPYGTAIQNARTTKLDKTGVDENHHMLADNAHLQDGIPCLTACYANVMAILQAIGQYKSVIGSQIVPTDEWRESHRIPDDTSLGNGLTEENIYLAQQCAVMAVKKPLQLSNMVELGMADS